MFRRNKNANKDSNTPKKEKLESPDQYGVHYYPSWGKNINESSAKKVQINAASQTIPTEAKQYYDQLTKPQPVVDAIFEAAVNAPTDTPNKAEYIERTNRLTATLRKSVETRIRHYSTSDVLIFEVGKTFIPKLALSKEPLSSLNQFLETYVAEGREAAVEFKPTVKYKGEVGYDRINRHTKLNDLDKRELLAPFKNELLPNTAQKLAEKMGLVLNSAKEVAAAVFLQEPVLPTPVHPEIAEQPEPLTEEKSDALKNATATELKDNWVLSLRKPTPNNLGYLKQ